jgi:hypothetical protein
MSSPVPFDKVKEAELVAIAARRRGRGEPVDQSGAVEKDLFGICFSGGGIRSATFNLGVLQGLASQRLLGLADYLSTVSGGGYIGSWFQALCCRKNSLGCKNVEEYLASETGKPETADKDPITFLRKYSNYLAPQLGFLSPDTWVIFTIWLRNTLLNQVILILAMGGALLLPIVMGNCARNGYHPEGSFNQWLPFGIVAIVAPLAWSVCRMTLANVRAVVGREFSPHPPDKAPDGDGAVWSLVAAPVFLASLMLSFLFSNVAFNDFKDPKAVVAVGTALLALFFLSLQQGGFFQCHKSRHKDPNPVWRITLGAVIIICCSLVTFGLLAAVAYVLPKGKGLEMWHAIAWGPPLAVLALSSGIALQIGLMGVDFPDSAREWYSRLGAKLTILCVFWAALFILVVFAPMLVIWFFEHWTKTGIGAAVGWLATTVAGFQAGKSPASSGKPPANSSAPRATNPVVEIVAKVAPPLAIAGLLIAVSTSSFLALEKKWPLHQGVNLKQSSVAQLSSLSVTTQGAGNLKVDWKPEASTSFLSSLFAGPHDYRALSLDMPCSMWVLLVACALLVLSYLMSLRVNVNEFSMNYFYKNRLVRCYLGASHVKNRHPNRFTGFDPRDDLSLKDLVPGEDHDAPYAILNCALNMNHGSELAWQERKASSFVFTPKYCGYDPVRPESKRAGYLPTEDLTGEGGPHLGLATAISGAAANPNWGYHTSPFTAFLMTIFNVRLGWWIGNTKQPQYAKTYGPPVALRYLFDELLGMTDEDSHYLNLSDGGHFENLGLYELIRRRCKFIIVGDGEQDDTYVFESLGGAIRKVRIDFGVEVEISPRRIILDGGSSAVHCATGVITYPGETEKGTLLYIKASLTGDESWDVSQYKRAHDAFPHESTLDQFFTESQFESYRALGRHAVDRIFDKSPAATTHAGLLQLFNELSENWLPPTTATAGAFTKHANAYSALLQRLSADNDLRFLDSQLLPCFPPAPAPAQGSPEYRKAMFLVTDFIQLMEDVYVDLNLEDDSQRCHQQNQGWIVLFKLWKGRTGGEVLPSVWKEIGKTYGTAFQRFYESL